MERIWTPAAGGGAFCVWARERGRRSEIATAAAAGVEDEAAGTRRERGRRRKKS